MSDVLSYLSAPLATGRRWRFEVAGSRLKPRLSCRCAEWVRRLGACCRCALLHHGLGLSTHRIQGCGTNNRATHTRAPLDVVIPTTATVPSCSEARQGRALRWRSRAILDLLLRAPASSTLGRDEETAAQVEQRNW